MAAARQQSSWKKLKRNLTLKNAQRLIFDPGMTLPALVALFVAEIGILCLVILKTKYTEIDWKAYMQEVEGVVNGSYNYTELKGDTGPLVYPAGFVYVFTGLYYLTDYGTNIRLAQYLFAALYLLSLLVIFDIYRTAKQVPPYVYFFMCCASYRVHSIYILRMFNDPVAMLFLYLAVCLFLRQHWAWGCFFYSLGVSIKMNLLLFSPALLLLLLVTQGAVGTVKHLVICALPQVVLAIPFLLVNPWGYIVQSFNLGRQFFYVWTVNWRLISEDVFLNKYFQLALLLAHVVVLVLFVWRRWIVYLPDIKMNLSSKRRVQLSSSHILLPLFTANFIGMCFSRSLHYQFYVWYFHSLHYLLWCTPLPVVVRVLLLGVIEMAWNTYPSTVFSSAALHACHALLLLGLWLSPHYSSAPIGRSSTNQRTAHQKIH